jgi:hypothetical protein
MFYVYRTHPQQSADFIRAAVVLFYIVFVLAVAVAACRDGECSVCEDTDFVWWGWCPGAT